MVRNCLTVAIRHLRKHAVYSLINISGLALGMACCMLIALFVLDEIGYDRHHEKSGRIYRILRETQADDGSVQTNRHTSGLLANALRQDLPEVEDAVRMHFRFNQWTRYEDQSFRVSWCHVEPNVFGLFDFRLLKGNPETVFEHPWSAVITEETARRYFADEDPVGKTLVVEGRVFPGTYRVTGVLKDLPKHSSLRFDALHSTVPLRGAYRRKWLEWTPLTWREIQTFVLLRGGVDPGFLENKLQDLMERYMGAEVRQRNAYYLQPLTRIHLYGRVDYGFSSGGISTIYILCSVGLFILLIACINFTNLETARSATRAREVGMRKVVGARRHQLIGQFLTESFLQAVLALLLAIGLAWLFLPAFNDFMRRDLSLELTGWTIAFTIGSAALIGLAAGSYPAFYLSSLHPLGTLKSDSCGHLRGVGLRKVLVVCQFTLSILLMVCTVMTYNQVMFMQNKDLGFDKEAIVCLPVFSVDSARKRQEDEWLTDRYEAVKQAFLEHPNVLKASAYRFRMGGWGGMIRQIRAEGHEEGQWRMPVQEADEDFLDTFGIELISGRTFTPGTNKEVNGEFILNETAVRILGWGNPIGKTFEPVTNPQSQEPTRGFRRAGTVIGVVRDYHYGPLREKIGPMAITLRDNFFSTLALKIRPEGFGETIAFLKTTWERFLPTNPFRFYFLDESLQRIYRRETRTAQIAGTFSLLSIFIASLGLLGLSAFTAARRTKEIGVRKVLGASVSRLINLLSIEYARLVLVANLIAWPAAYFLMARFLQTFAYRTEMSVGPFLLAGVVALLIALLTVGSQTIRVARSNPADVLRYE